MFSDIPTNIVKSKNKITRCNILCLLTRFEFYILIEIESAFADFIFMQQ